jgi:hypothetical protein
MNHRIALLALICLAACGKRDDLRPAAGASLPPRPLTAPVQPTVPELLQTTPEANPDRNDDVLKRSQERKEDRFELPPPR